MNVMQQPGPDLPYGTVPGAPLLNGQTFFWYSLTFGWKMLQKSLRYQGARAMLILPGNKMVTWHNHLLHHFSITIHLNLASFYTEKYF